MNYDHVYEMVDSASREIDTRTADYIFGDDQCPAELRRKLVNIQQEIDRLASLAVRHVENHADDFGPDDTYFVMPAQISIHWSRENQSIVSAEVIADTGWSPSTVTDEDDNTHTSDDTQCESWRRALRNEINGYSLA